MTSQDEKTIKTAMIAAAGIGAPGVVVPALDMAVVSGIWTAMVVQLARDSDHPRSPPMAGKLVASALSGVSAYQLGSKALTFAAVPLVVAFPLAGVPAVVAADVMLNGLFTYRLGTACAERFARADFTTSDMLDLGLSITGHLLRVPRFQEVVRVRRLLFR